MDNTLASLAYFARKTPEKARRHVWTHKTSVWYFISSFWTNCDIIGKGYTVMESVASPLPPFVQRLGCNAGCWFQTVGQVSLQDLLKLVLSTLAVQKALQAEDSSYFWNTFISGNWKEDTSREGHLPRLQFIYETAAKVPFSWRCWQDGRQPVTYENDRVDLMIAGFV